MGFFNTIATTLIADLDRSDAAYCQQLGKRFANMGIPQESASSAVVSFIEADAVPTNIPYAATPSLFPQIPAKESSRFASEMAQTA